VPKKRTFDFKEMQAKKQAEEEAKANERVDDPYGVKLTNVTFETNVDDIWQAMSKFGQIAKDGVFIP